MSYEELRQLRNTKATEVEQYFEFLDVHLRLNRIKERQIESTTLLNRLLALVDKIVGDTSPPPAPRKTATPGHQYYSDSHCPFASSSSSGISSSGGPSSLSPPSGAEKRFCRTTTSTAKRKIFDDDYQEFSTEDDMSSSTRQRSHQESINSQYPQHLNDMVILGPNGTKIDARSYNSIIWTSSAAATRQLLGFVFTNDILATHTLTGKPSPAFYGRERPAKMQLDPVKAGDIIHCVRSQFNCSEREIRAAITTKCSDTSKKYKRRSQKQLEVSERQSEKAT